jgi:hypothetical protein
VARSAGHIGAPATSRTKAQKYPCTVGACPSPPHVEGPAAPSLTGSLTGWRSGGRLQVSEVWRLPRHPEGPASAGLSRLGADT